MKTRGGCSGGAAAAAAFIPLLIVVNMTFVVRTRSYRALQVNELIQLTTTTPTTTPTTYGIIGNEMERFERES